MQESAASVYPALTKWIRVIGKRVIPDRPLPDFTTYLAADFSLESAHTPEQKTACVSARGITALEFDKHAALLFRNAHRMRVSQVPVEFFRDQELPVVYKDEECIADETWNTAVRAPRPRVRLATFSVVARALLKSDSHFFARREGLCFEVHKRSCFRLCCQHRRERGKRQGDEQNEIAGRVADVASFQQAEHCLNDIEILLLILSATPPGFMRSQ